MKDDEDFGFGDGGFCKLYGDRLADSSLLECAVASRWIFLYMLARADSVGRFRCATVAGLARAAAVSLADASKAVAELEAPDPDSSSPDRDGRRIVRFSGGWQIVTYAKYRDYRTKRQIADAERQKRHRERDMSRDVTVTSAPVTVTSAPDVRRQTSDVRDNEQRKAPDGAPAGGGNISRKGAGAATARELQTLEADPALVALGDAWVQAFRRPRRELGVLRAARTALAGGYDPEAVRLVVRVVALAREAPERFPDRGSIRWAVEHGKSGDPGYLLRPATLDRLIPEAEEWDRA